MMQNLEDLSPEEQLREVAAGYNLLVRKNRSLVERVAQSEDRASDMQARAEEQIAALQEENKQLRQELGKLTAPQQTAPQPPQEPVEVPAANEDSDLAVPV